LDLDVPEGWELTQVLRIGLFCADDALAKAVVDSLEEANAPAATRLPSFGDVLEFAEESGAAVVLVSLADLCAEGLDAINLADMEFSVQENLRRVLLVEPWVAGELPSISLMTGFNVSIPTSDVHTDLIVLLRKMFPGGGLSTQAIPEPPSSRSVEVDAGRRIVVRNLAGLTGGRLQDVWLPRVLYSLFVQSFTGVLSLKGLHRSMKIHFSDGVAGGVQDRNDREHLLAAFAWTHGRFDVQRRSVSPDEFSSFGSMLDLIYDGCMEFVSTNEAAERLSAFEHSFPACTEFVSQRVEFLEARDVLKGFCLSCDGSRSWSRVISATWPEVRRVLKSAIFALETDLVVMLDSVGEGTVEVRYETGTVGRGVGAVVPSAVMTAADGAKLLTLLRTRLEYFDRIDAYSLFGLKPQCGVEAVRRQFYRMVKQHHPDTYGGNLPGEIQVMAEVVFMHIKDANVELLNLEQLSDAAGSRIIKPSERVVSGVRSKEATTRTAEKAHESGKQRAPSTSPKVRSRRRVGAPPPPPSSEVVALGDESKKNSPAPRGETRPTPSGPPTSPRPSRPVRRSRHPPSSRSVKARVPARAPAKSRPRGSAASERPQLKASEQRDQMMRKLPPKKHFSNGQKALQNKQYDRAKEAFRYAAEGDGGNELYAAHLAFSRYLSDPAVLGSALAMLKRAASGAAASEAHLFAARIHKLEGQSGRALEEYLAVLEVDPKNIEALREVRLDRMRRGSDEADDLGEEGEDGSFFSKLFGRKKDT
jgi:hypothetical protein